MARRTIQLDDDRWRQVRGRAVADDKTPSQVIEAAVDTAVIAGGPLIYGDNRVAWRMRNIHEWVMGTEAGKAAGEAFAEELEAEDIAEGREPINPFKIEREAAAKH